MLAANKRLSDVITIISMSEPQELDIRIFHVVLGVRGDEERRNPHYPTGI